MQQLYQRLASILTEALQDPFLSEEDRQFVGILTRNLSRNARSGTVPSLKSIRNVGNLRNSGSEAQNALKAIHSRVMLENAPRGGRNNPNRPKGIDRAAGTTSPGKTSEARLPVTVTRQLEDENGYFFEPEPLTAHTPTELVDHMRKFRIWAGEPSLRELAHRSGGSFAASTLCKVLKESRLPPQDLVIAFIRACGGSESDVRQWSTAWRKTPMPQMLP
ncbi:hypothetical protein [Streptosporangium canum]|uniref:hypothetical protein n=1 Tax=Streptosporangium canum TaxID=324952 RepID=UPI00343604C0